MLVDASADARKDKGGVPIEPCKINIHSHN